MSGWVFLAIGAFVTITDLAVGAFLVRRAADGAGLYANNQAMDGAAAARAGRLVMIVAPLFFLIFAALAFGIVPIEAIDPISLGGGQ